MKTKDRLKEEIGFEKLLLTLLVAVVSSLSSWAWSNREILSEKITGFIYLFLIFLVITSFLIFIKIKFKIRELDHYDN